MTFAGQSYVIVLRASGQRATSLKAQGTATRTVTKNKTIKCYCIVTQCIIISKLQPKLIANNVNESWCNNRPIAFRQIKPNWYFKKVYFDVWVLKLEIPTCFDTVMSSSRRYIQKHKQCTGNNICAEPSRRVSILLKDLIRRHQHNIYIT